MTTKKLRIGLLVDYIMSDYTQLLMLGIKKACLENNIEFFLFPIAELHNIKYGYDYQNVAVTAFLSSKNLDGILFCSGTQMHCMSKADLTSYLKSYNTIPIVNVSAEVPGFPSILVECYNAYKELLTNLIQKQGCKKFGLISARGNNIEGKARTKYVKAILEENGISAKGITIWKGNFDFRTTISELEAYYEVHKSFDFDALICLNDEMAFGALQFCRKIGKRIPEDLVITGFDDLERSAYCVPPLTSINQQIELQGEKGVHLLMDVIAGKQVPRITTIDAKAVFRESTAKLSDEDISENRLIESAMYKNSLAKYSGNEWHYKKHHFIQVGKFFTEMQADITIDQLRTRINDDLRSFKISACGIVLYENPIEMSAPFDYFNLPHKASVFSCFDDYIGFDSNKTKKKYKFDPNEYMFPQGLLQYNHEGMIVMSLFHNNLQYGYILMRPGEYDVAVYDIFIKMMSTSIANIYSFALMHSETTKYRAQYDKMDVIARTDELTGLNNRRGLYDLGQTTLKFAKAMQQSGMIVYCDMDGLKKINDTFGHEAGDRAIVAESIILRGNFRSNDVVARIGGDEFAIVSPGLTQEAFERIRKQVDDDCAKWSDTNDTPYTLSISMGAVPYPNDSCGYQITPLLAKADSALYDEKCRRKSQVK